MRNRKENSSTSAPGSSKSSQKQSKRPVTQIPKTKAESPPPRVIGREHPNSKRGSLTKSQQEAKLRGLAAINRVRKGVSETLTEGARAEGTTVKAIRKLLPGALTKQKQKGRIRVKAGDTYSARVEILTASGPLAVTARGSRERELAGLHRAEVIRVLNGKDSTSSLSKFHGKKVGGHELISNFDELRKLVLAGVLGHLDNLYVSPGGSS